MTALKGPSSALLGLLRKETYHILRDRRTLLVITLIPIVQVIIFGAAIRTDVQHVRLGIVDPAPDPVVLRRVYLDVIGRLPSAAEARTFLTDG